MLSRSLKCTTARIKDRTARALFNLGRRTRILKPYVMTTRLGVTEYTVDTELFEKFWQFCATVETEGLGEMELYLFGYKFTTEVRIPITDDERAKVFNELSNNIMLLVEDKARTDKYVTEYYRIDSETNMKKENLC